MLPGLLESRIWLQLLQELKLKYMILPTAKALVHFKAIAEAKLLSWFPIIIYFYSQLTYFVALLMLKHVVSHSSAPVLTVRFSRSPHHSLSLAFLL